MFGGSQGARTINRAIVDALRHLLPIRRARVHRARHRAVEEGRLRRRRATCARGWSRATRSRSGRRLPTSTSRGRSSTRSRHVYALTDLAVTRGGAGSLYELASLGLPAIVIPKSNLPGDHQVMNARAMARCGGAVVVYEEAALDRGPDRRAGGRPDVWRRRSRRCWSIRAGWPGWGSAAAPSAGVTRSPGSSGTSRATAPASARGGGRGGRRSGGEARPHEVLPSNQASARSTRARRRRDTARPTVPRTWCRRPATAPTSSAGRPRCW